MNTATSASCIQAVSGAWERMMNLLFRPFVMETWFVMGFGAWLAQLGRGGGGGSYNYGGGSPEEYGDVSGVLEKAWVSIQPYFSWICTIGAVAIAFLLLIGLVIAWVSARGRFVLLDNVLTGQARIKVPWEAYREEAFSLFLFEVVLGLVLAVISLGALATVVLPMAPFFLGDGTGGLGAILSASMLNLIVGVPIFILAVIFGSVVNHLLDNFIVPIMAVRRIRTRAAFALFLPLWRAHLGGFVLYAIMRMILWVGVMSAITMFGFMTCCCGFFILAIPYIGTVVMLPIYIFMRGMGPEYLAQFGPEFYQLPLEPVPMR